MTTYVVGVDAIGAAPVALDWACAVAGDEDRIVAVHSWEIPVVTGYETAAAVDTSAIEQAAQDFLADVLAGRDDGRISGRVLSGHPGGAIVEAVEELGGGAGGVSQDVTAVVGHAGSSKIGLLLGSTANHVVRHARGATVVVRGDTRIPVRRLVVGMDDPDDGAPDPPSLAALRWALGRQGVERIEVHHAAFVPGVAAGPFSQPGMESEAGLDALDRQLREAIATALGDHPATPTGAEIVPVVAGGTGGFDLIEASREADLIVVGTRGHTGLRDLITGSTTLEVIAHAHCPVAVIR